MYLLDLRQSGWVRWEEVEGLLMLLFMLSRTAMAMLFLKWLFGHIWMYYHTRIYGGILRPCHMDVLSYMDIWMYYQS